MRYFVRMSYDGSKFHGFQRLTNANSVQKKLENALSIIDRRPVFMKGAGRTDRGVHAYGQCAHFDLQQEFAPDTLKKILNKMIGPYVVLTEVKQVPDSFHARFDVLEKHYQYRVFMGPMNPFLEDYVLYYPYELDVGKMREAASLLVGAHDFQNFVSGERKDYRCVIRNICITQNEDTLIFDFYGASFYRYMVRNLVGCLLLVGRGKSTCQDVLDALNFPNQKKMFWTAPSKGLYLMEIRYKGNENESFF